MMWSRKQETNEPDSYVKYAEVPGGALVRYSEKNSPPSLCFVPNVYVYDAGGMGGPFLRDIKDKDED